MGSGDFNLSSMSRGDGQAPCKACNAFKTWAKTQKASVQEEHKLKQCPLDKEELGHSTWGYLHTMAAYFPDKPTDSEKSSMKDFFKIFAQFYPCNVCATHFQQDVKNYPPEVSSGDTLSQWLCRMHNKVNERIGKPVFDCSKVRERWKEGWPDGSCD